MLISGISWSGANNKIVTCSHDRNAFVWTFSESSKSWNPILCVLRINRAAVDVQWSPDGSKFAVGSGDKCVPVCHYDNSQGNDWYVSKMIKKHKSTVLKVAWHPNSQVLATVCTDFRCRIVSASLVGEGIDPAPAHEPMQSHLPFGEVYAEFPCTGWALACAWSPDGRQLCFTGHDSSVQVIAFGEGGAQTMQTVRYSLLPSSCAHFLSESTLVTAGHDMAPLLFTRNAAGKWSFSKVLDQGNSSATKANDQSKIQAARALFQSKTSRGESASNAGADIKTVHQRHITCLQPFSGKNAASSQFSTTGLDGRIALWDLATLNIDMAALHM
jgi:actin related protein 2/3 complex subunit 1A/1B